MISLDSVSSLRYDAYMKRYSEADLREDLRQKCTADEQSTVARSLGFSPQFICDVLAGRRGISVELASAMGYRKLPAAFVRKHTTVTAVTTSSRGLE